jgi:hypothetical protein
MLGLQNQNPSEDPSTLPLEHLYNLREVMGSKIVDSYKGDEKEVGACDKSLKLLGSLYIK